MSAGLITAPAPLVDLHTDANAYVLRLLWLLCRDPKARAIAVFSHDGIPVPKARARVGMGGRHFTPKHVEKAENDLAVMFQVHVRPRPIAGPLALVSLFFRPDHRRMDGDNLQKLVMDAGTKAGIWHDDSQVTASTWFVDLDIQRPRTVIGLAPAISNLRRQPPKEKRWKQQ